MSLFTVNIGGWSSDQRVAGLTPCSVCLSCTVRSRLFIKSAFSIQEQQQVLQIMKQFKKFVCCGIKPDQTLPASHEFESVESFLFAEWLNNQRISRNCLLLSSNSEACMFSCRLFTVCRCFAHHFTGFLLTCWVLFLFLNQRN